MGLWEGEEEPGGQGVGRDSASGQDLSPLLQSEIVALSF